MDSVHIIFVFVVYSLVGNDVLEKVNTVGGVGFISTSISLSDAVAVSVLPAELIGFTSFGLTGIVLKAPPTKRLSERLEFLSKTGNRMIRLTCRLKWQNSGWIFRRICIQIDLLVFEQWAIDSLPLCFDWLWFASDVP